MVFAASTFSVLLPAVAGTFELRHASFAVYLTESAEPAATVKVEHAFQDYQTRGFFRVGALPMLVLEGLNLETREPAKLAEVLREATSACSDKRSKAGVAEARGFTLSLGGLTPATLRASRARFISPSQWFLEKGTATLEHRQAVPFSQAILIVTGAHAGELVCENPKEAGPIRLFDVPRSSVKEAPIHQVKPETKP